MDKGSFENKLLNSDFEAGRRRGRQRRSGERSGSAVPGVPAGRASSGCRSVEAGTAARLVRAGPLSRTDLYNLDDSYEVNLITWAYPSVLAVTSSVNE
ncbi:unnamed protein product, partial [Nesidiocoris tenuis]